MRCGWCCGRLDTAAEADTATGGVDRNGRIFPIIKIITAKGIETITDDTMRALFNAGRHLPDQSGDGGVAVGGPKALFLSHVRRTFSLR